MWNEDEIAAVKKHLRECFLTLKTPNKAQCEKCLKEAGHVLEARTWSDVKYYVYNCNVTNKKSTKKL